MEDTSSAKSSHCAAHTGCPAVHTICGLIHNAHGNPRFFNQNIPLVHTLICLRITSFLHRFQQICKSSFPMYARQTTFNIKQTFQCI